MLIKIFMVLTALALQGCATGGQWDINGLAAASESWSRIGTPYYMNTGAPSLNQQTQTPINQRPQYSPLRVTPSNPYGY